MRSVTFAAAVSAAAALFGAAAGADPLPADNPLLLSSGFLSGSGRIRVAKLGPDGALWIAGESKAREIAGLANPIPPNAGRVVQPDAFVVRLDASTRVLLSGLWIGGSGEDLITGLDFDAQGRAYVVGSTVSPDFPAPAGDAVTEVTMVRAFAGRLSEDARSFTWLRRFTSETVATGMCMTDGGDPVVVGFARGSEFELVAPLPGVNQSLSGERAFATRISADGRRVVFSTLFDRLMQHVSAVAVSPGRILLAGDTFSGDVPGAVQILAPESSSNQGVLVEIDQEATQIVRTGLLGSFQPDSLAVSEDAVFVAGSLHEFVPSAARTRSDPKDAGILRLDPVTWDIGASVVHGGAGDESGIRIALGDDGKLWLSGATAAADMAVAASIRPGSSDVLRSGNSDAFVAAFEPGSLGLEFSTYLGGGGNDDSVFLVTGPDGTAWVAGSTESPDFPVVPTLAAAASPGGFFVAKIRRGDAALVPNAPVGVAGELTDERTVRLTFADGGGGTATLAVDRIDEGRRRRVALLPPDATEWTDTGVLSDHAYSYVLQALNAHGGSAPSESNVLVLEPTLAVSLDRAEFQYDRRFDRPDHGRMRGTVRRLDGGAVDVRAGGLEIALYVSRGAETAFSVPPNAAGWTGRGARLRYRDATTRLTFNAVTGAFDARTVRRLPSPVRRESQPLQIRSGRDAGTSTSVWRTAGELGVRTR